VKKRHKALFIILSVVIGVPLIMWFSWFLTTPKPISIFIMDKTSYSTERARNRALNWVLTHYSFVKTDGKKYDPVQDYYGFFPLTDKQYKINDLQGLTDYELARMAIDYHAAYFTDNYGVYSDSWPEEKPGTFPVTKIYGGLHEEDLRFLDHMIKRDRLVITEFSFMGPPTEKDLKEKAEKLMGLEWQGWTGKFFHTFDPAQEKSVPPWVPVLYKKQNGNPWPREQQGVIFVHEDETLVVLEYPKHISTPYPLVMTDRPQRRKFGVSNRIPYPGWFDITMANCDNKTVLSWFELNLTPEGRVLLQSHGIPARFPAVIKQKDTNRMYYFAGDFGYSPLKHRFVKFKGSRYAELFFSDLTDPTDKNGFFYTYYLPLMKNIIQDYHQEILNR
jgi:hypothetical protein